MSKISKILGVGLVVAVLASLFVAAAPASAGTLAWGSESTVGFPADTGSDITDLAVAGNGTTIYAIGSGFGASTTGGMVKSANSGSTWAAVTLPTTPAITAVTSIALAPDVADGAYVVIVTDKTNIFLSENGGTSFVQVPSPGVTINDIDVGKSVSGVRTLAVAGADGNLWLLDIGLFATWTSASGAGWNSGNFTAGQIGLAVAISPNYIGDRTVALVTSNTSEVKIQLANTNAKAWNMNVYAGWAQGIQVAAVTSNKASLVLAPSFLGSDPGSRIAYIGVDSGLYRIVDFSGKAALSAAPINSVALNTAGDKLVAGAVGSNLVYRVATPVSAAASSAAPSVGFKSPGYNDLTTKVAVGFAGTTVVAGTSGPESAFATSADDGKDFSDVSLVDSVFTPVDFAVKADGSVVYVASASGTVVSLWKKTTAWSRVFAQADTASAFVVRAAPENSDVVYLAEKLSGTANSNLWYTNDGGATTWVPRYSPIAIVDMDVEAAAIIWLTGEGQVSKSTDSGFTYDIAPTAKILGFTSNSIDVVAKDSVIVGGTAGEVMYTADGGATWSAKLAAGTAAVQVTADKLSSGGVIYAAGGNTVYSYTIGTSTSFGKILDAGLALPATGIALSGSVLYVTSANSTDSLLYRTLTPAAGGWNAGLAATASFNNPPRALFVTVGSDKNPKLWAIDTEAKALDSFTDTLTLAGPALAGPANGTIIAINSANGQSMDVPFQWKAVSTETAYSLQVSLDSNFTQQITPTGGVTVSNATLLLLGPTANSGPAYQPDQTYYWRVRATTPLNSPYSATGNFKIATLAPLKIVSPETGAQNVSINPDFSWTTVSGATNYEIFVSDDPTFAVITFSANSPQAVYASTEALAYSTTYYWRVRASAPAAAVTPFAYGIFTTGPKPTTPTPPITITQTNTTITQTVPPPVNVIPNYLLWIIIGIGAILVIALIVLIVRTRRTS